MFIYGCTFKVAFELCSENDDLIIATVTKEVGDGDKKVAEFRGLQARLLYEELTSTEDEDEHNHL